MAYNNPTPVAVCIAPVLVGNRLKLLGVIRNNAPGIGGKALGGGYVDELESFEEAAAREFHEEIGPKTSPEDWQLFCSKTSPQNRALVFCILTKPLADVFGAEITEEFVANLPIVSDEVQGYVLIDDKTELVFSLHQEVVARYYRHESVVLKAA